MAKGSRDGSKEELSNADASAEASAHESEAGAAPTTGGVSAGAETGASGATRSAGGSPEPAAAAEAGTVTPASAGPTAAATAAASGAGATAVSHPIGERAAHFMVASRPAMGPDLGRGLGLFAAAVQPLSADVLAMSLQGAPGIEIVKKIEPPKLLGLQSIGLFSGPSAAPSPLIVARMSHDKARLLQAQGGAAIAVEHDAPVTFGLEPGPINLNLPNPGVLVPLSDGFEAVIEVQGPEGPLAGAEVYVFGSMLPAHAVTDGSGRARISITGESPETIRAIYVKPKVNYWDIWQARPALVPDAVNTITAKPLSAFLKDFPQRQLLGWGQYAMGLDQVPQGYDGAGIKIAIVDSGAAQLTHRNLHQLGPGISVIGTDRSAWSTDVVGHGSHCAGIIAGGPVATSTGVRGFAPAAEIHILRIFPGAHLSDLVSALDYCMENGIDVVNMSLGGGEPSQIVEERLVKAKAMGIACIVAAGNSAGPVQFPASTPHVLAVTAIGKSGEFPSDSFHATQLLPGFEGHDGYFPAKFSCFGPEIDVCAPGVAIVSSLPPDDFGAWDGTSMAAPHVTGLAALVLAHHPDFRGAFQARDARRVERLFQIIKESATPLPISDAARIGAGLPHVARALGLQPTGERPSAATAAAADPMMEALRKILAALGSAGHPNSGPAVQPQSWSVMPLRNPEVARGPAQTGGMADSLAPASTDFDVVAARDLLRRTGLL